MPYAIIATDDPGKEALRRQHRQAHVQHLASNAHRLLAAGALLSEEGNPTGSLIVVDTESRAEAEAFLAADPYASEGLFVTVQVVRWRKGFFNYENLLPAAAR